MKPLFPITIALLALLFTTGCDTPSDAAAEHAKHKAAEEKAAAEAEEDPNEVAARKRARAIANRNKGVKILEREARFVEYDAAMEENPNRFEAVNGIAAQDPLSAVTQGFFAGASRIETLGREHELEILKQLTGDGEDYPTYDEYREHLKSNGVVMKGLKPYQMYAYKPEEGKIVILEDPDEAKQWEARAVGK